MSPEREKYLRDLLTDNRKLWANCMTNPLKEVFEELDRVRADKGILVDVNGCAVESMIVAERDQLKVENLRLSEAHEAAQHYKKEMDQLKAENVELRKVYSSACPECGYSGCVRGRKACDTEIDQLREKLEVAVEKFKRVIQNSSYSMSKADTHRDREVFEIIHNDAQEALAKLRGEK